VMFDRGEVIEQGPPSEILLDPSHPRTSAFLQALLDHDRQIERPG
jgi:ABC-type dipeptide/oligopeptide/nickel transport system ATPase component